MEEEEEEEEEDDHDHYPDDDDDEACVAKTVTYASGDNYKTKRNCVYVTSYTKLAEICRNLRYMS